MRQRYALPAGAVRSADVRSAWSGRRPPQVADTLERLSTRLDYLIRDVRLGARSQREHDRHVDEAEAIATEIRGAFRTATSPQPAHPPLWQDGHGRAAW